MPSHHLKQSWFIIVWILWNKLQWNSNQNANLFIMKMHLKMSSAKWRPFSPERDELKWDHKHLCNCCYKCIVYTCLNSWHLSWYNFIYVKSMYGHSRAKTLLSFKYNLIHLPLNKMAAISQDNLSVKWQPSCWDIFRCIFLNEKFCILIESSLKFVPKGPIDNIPALVQIMAWHLFGAKPLSEPMLTRFTDAYMWH